MVKYEVKMTLWQITYCALQMQLIFSDIHKCLVARHMTDPGWLLTVAEAVTKLS